MISGLFFWSHQLVNVVRYFYCLLVWKWKKKYENFLWKWDGCKDHYGTSERSKIVLNLHHRIFYTKKKESRWCLPQSYIDGPLYSPIVFMNFEKHQKLNFVVYKNTRSPIVSFKNLQNAQMMLVYKHRLIWKISMTQKRHRLAINFTICIHTRCSNTHARTHALVRIRLNMRIGMIFSKYCQEKYEFSIRLGQLDIL